jgi:hypothetical protein
MSMYQTDHKNICLPEQGMVLITHVYIGRNPANNLTFESQTRFFVFL